ncbi:MAG: signal peptide peptidase SppA, type [Verrucomicrobia bacterium]|jgi:protease-4|nr:signal peptide peptidase SppA, type [Verrucomicrobiota bacterium]
MDNSVPPNLPPSEPTGSPYVPPANPPPQFSSSYQMPPPLAVAPPKKEKKHPLMWILLVLLAVGGGLFVLMGVFGALLTGGGAGMSGGVSTRSMLQEVVTEPSESSDKIAVIGVEGIITGSSLDSSGTSMVDIIKEQLRRAGEDVKVKAVILKVDSPGGEVLASDDIYRAIQKFQNEHSKPVIASMGSLAASGGYYVSAPCRWIVANELTLTGSIGVIMSGYNYRGLMDKVGVFPLVYKSGKFKDMLSGSKKPEEIMPEENQMMQSLIDETYGKFKSIVKEGREASNKDNGGKGKALGSDWESLADGRILSGNQAYQAGLVDELGDWETTVKRTLTIAGITDAKQIRYARPFTLGSLFGLSSKAQPTTIKIDLGMDAPKLKAGHLYFLSSSVLH